MGSSSRLVVLWGLEGLINGLPKPTMGLLGTRMLYDSEICMGVTWGVRGSYKWLH